MRNPILSALALVLVGCVPGPRVGRSPYAPRENNGDGYGYAQTQINSRVFEVYFAGVSDADAHDGVLRRSAELTLQTGFDGFFVVASDDRGEERVRSRFVIGRVRRHMPTAILTINMLMREDFQRAPSMVYDAHLLGGAQAR